jgi:hypothetical protein
MDYFIYTLPAAEWRWEKRMSFSHEIKTAYFMLAMVLNNVNDM